ncbi:MAG: hypothetical protein M0R03_07080 [Novosphingobium sp.]|nr:hypothetical protein [Novosphingobium sp.]
MKKIAYAALVSAAALSLAACGKSDDASEQAMAENVELPAEEAVGDATAVPSEDAAATDAAATDMVADAGGEAAAEVTTPAAEPKM